jgi:hypothetical protein
LRSATTQRDAFQFAPISLAVIFSTPSALPWW